jgi:secondary thiamine-phosphate synthase enzyme
MRLYQKTLEIATKKRMDFIEITKDVQKMVDKSKIKDGMVFLNTGHTTAALLLQENDPTIHRDLTKILERISPLDEGYEHDYEGNENATGHIRNALLHSSLTIPLKNGKLLLGTWQRIFFIELFEPRRREVFLTVIGK